MIEMKRHQHAKSHNGKSRTNALTPPHPGLSFHRVTSYLTPYSISSGATQWGHKSCTTAGLIYTDAGKVSELMDQVADIVLVLKISHIRLTFLYDCCRLILFPLFSLWKVLQSSRSTSWHLWIRPIFQLNPLNSTKSQKINKFSHFRSLDERCFVIFA